MPAIVGSFVINNNSSGGIIEVGDTFLISPKATSKFFNGAGSYLVGNVAITGTSANSTLVNDSDVIDSSTNTGV
ncbi:spore germination protein [Tumebacillus sp. BK434]|uniref:spore germination protein n=1 Tax=Tumebacillus sp. BK434 TaxID=2512169 RepID=UPI0010531B51|nr:spore germination protein [Tumebacillus sp. BK434]